MIELSHNSIEVVVTVVVVIVIVIVVEDVLTLSVMSVVSLIILLLNANCEFILEDLAVATVIAGVQTSILISLPL